MWVNANLPGTVTVGLEELRSLTLRQRRFFLEEIEDYVLEHNARLEESRSKPTE